jgi:NAD(P)-dependent dehydrogenase (short-subunit alcohol dehydrogenase family)
MKNRRLAVVTGGGQGIGKATAMAFVRAGYAVLIVEVDGEAAREVIQEPWARRWVRVVRADVSREPSVKAMVRAALEWRGRIDVLVNNAGISCGRPVTDLSLAQWNRVLGVNLTGVFLCAKHAAPHLAEVNGTIVNLSSTRALMSEPNTEAYSASKGGVVALTHALAVSLGPRVRVNCICPGWIEVGAWKKKARRQEAVLSEQDHRQHPVGRVGRPEDVASLVLYLAGPESGFMTGAVVPVDGGMTRKMIYV